jgi:hypothetical protein
MMLLDYGINFIELSSSYIHDAKQQWVFDQPCCRFACLRFGPTLTGLDLAISNSILNLEII